MSISVNIARELDKTDGRAYLRIGDIEMPVMIGDMTAESNFRGEAVIKFDGVRILSEPTPVKKEEPKKEEPDNTFRIEKVTVNGPATIVFWKDGTKTVVKCQNGDKFDLEKGMAMAFAKKARGNSSKYYDVIKDITHQYRVSKIAHDLGELNEAAARLADIVNNTRFGIF